MPNSQRNIPFVRLIFAAVALAGACSVTLWADQVVMKNGDRITGDIVKQDGKSITIKTANFDVVNAPWDRVVSIQSDLPLTVELKDGKTVAGALSTREGQVEIAGKDAKVNVAPDQIAAIRNADEQRIHEQLQAPGIGQLWSGIFNLGWAGTSGNAKTLTFTISTNADRVTRTDKTSVYFKLIKASALVNGVNSDTAEAVRGGIAYDHNLSSRLFLNVFNDYDYDRFQNLDLRFVLGGGLGYHAIKTERSTLDLLAGAAYNRSDFSTQETTDSAELFWGDEYRFKMNDSTSFTQSFRMFNNLTNTGEYRINADIGLTTKLKRWLNWTVSLSDRYVTNPAPGRKTNDWLYATGLGITFGQ